jgi:GGDEF domain-containing protein
VVGTYTKYKVTASIGCSVFPRDAEDFEGLFKAADAGLYVAKRGGKNQLSFYNTDEKKEND